MDTTAKQLNSTNQQTLVKALHDDDCRALGLYAAYAGRTRRYAAAILRDTALADEVVQEVFMAVWNHRRRLDSSRSVQHYLMRAVHNNALCRLQAERARRRRERSAATQVHLPHRAPDEEVVHTLDSRLQPAIEGLSEQNQRILQMSYWEGKTNAAIAAELGLSVRGVETALYRSLRRLREQLCAPQ